MTLRNTPNKAMLISERLAVRMEYDLGRLADCEQSPGEHPGQSPRQIVTLHDGKRVKIVSGTSQGGSGSFYTEIANGEAGPMVYMRDGRLLERVYGTHGARFCETVDRLREQLDETTGEHIIEGA